MKLKETYTYRRPLQVLCSPFLRIGFSNEAEKPGGAPGAARGGGTARAAEARGCRSAGQGRRRAGGNVAERGPLLLPADRGPAARGRAQRKRPLRRQPNQRR